MNLLHEFQCLLSALESNRIDYALCGGSVSVVSPEGLIHLKSMRKSGQDMDDINYLRGIIDEN